MVTDPHEVATRALDYLQMHHCMSIATDGPEGLWAATVFYVNEGFALDFVSLSDTRHARNLDSNPRVAVTIGDDAETWQDISGIQVEGSVVHVDAPDERRNVLQLFLNRYPFPEGVLWWTDSPPDPNAGRRVYRIEPTRVLFINHAFDGARSEIPATHLRR